MEDRVVDFWISGFDLPDLAAHHDEVVDNFVNEAKRLVRQGAEVIYSAGISQCPVHMRPDWLQEQLRVPVVEGFGTPMRMAALLAGLGLTQSRARWVKSRNLSMRHKVVDSRPVDLRFKMFDRTSSRNFFPAR